MYCSHFGLHRPPFNNTPDPSFYYSTPDHEEALATLQYATVNRKGFVLVTGEVGAGKTLIGRMFIRQIDRQASTAVITHTQLNARQLLAAICSEFELEVPGDLTNLQLADRLQEYLLEQFARDRFVVVLIDEGQNLPDDSFEALRMLGNLEADDAKLLQVCILGQPELRDRFKRESMRQLDQRMFRRFHLPALNQQQTTEYVERRLRVAGCSRADLFAPAALADVFAVSGGVPRVINQICDNALLAAYAQGREVVDGAIVAQVLEQEGMTDPAAITQAARGSAENRDVSAEADDENKAGFAGARAGSDERIQARIEQIYGTAPELVETGVTASATTETAAAPASAPVSIPQVSNAAFNPLERADGAYRFRDVVSGAAQQWPVVREAIENQRREMQRGIDEVIRRCQQAEAQIENIAATAAPTAEVTELRDLHASETRRVLDEISRTRTGMEQIVQQTESRLLETEDQLRKLRANTVPSDAIGAVEKKQEQRITDVVTRFDQYRQHVEDLVQLLRHQCDQTQGSVAGLAESCAKMRTDLTDRLDERLDDLHRQLQEQLASANPTGQIDALCEAQARTRSELASQFEARLSELQERMHRQISTATSQEIDALRAAQTRTAEQQTHQFENKLAELRARLQEELSTTAKASDVQALRQETAKPADVEAVRESAARSAEQIKNELESQLTRTSQEMRTRVRRTVRGLGALREQQDRQQAALKDDLEQQLGSAREQLQEQIVGTSRDLAGLKQNTEQTRVRQDGLLFEHKAAIDDLARGVVRCEGQIKSLNQDLAARLTAVATDLGGLKASAASAVEVKALREEHLAGIANLRGKLDAESDRLDQMKTAMGDLLARASKEQAAGLSALSTRLEEESRHVRQVRRRLVETHAALQERLTRIEETCASRGELDKLRQEHTADTARLGDEIQTGRDEVQRWQQQQAAETSHLADEIEAGRTHLEQLRQDQVAETTRLENDIRAGRTDVEQLRQAHQAQADQTAGEIQANRNALQLMIDGLAKRSAAIQQRLEALAQFAKADSEQLGALRSTHAEDVANLLRQLEDQRQLTEARFQQTVTDWTRTQQELDALRERAADAAALEELRSVETRHCEEVRQAMAEHRGAIESLVQAVDSRCDDIMSQVDMLAARSAEDVQAVRNETAADKVVIQAAIRSVADQCELTASALSGLEGRAATQNQVADLAETHARDLEAVVSRIEGHSQAYEQEFENLKQRWAHLQQELHELAHSSTSVEKFEAAERLINEDLGALKERLDDVAHRRRKDVHVLVDVSQRLTERIRTLEEMERPQPVRIELRPEAARELASLNTAAQQQAVDMRNLLGGAEALGERLRDSSTRVEQVMREWLTNATSMQQQSQQLRESAQVSAGVIEAMRKCSEMVEAKLKSKRWQNIEQVAARLEQTAERIQEDSQTWVEHRDEARQVVSALTQLIAEAKGAEQRMTQMTKGAEQRMTQMTGRLGSIAAGMAHMTSGLSGAVTAALEFDEQQRPTGSPERGRKHAPNATSVNWPKYRTHAASRAG